MTGRHESGPPDCTPPRAAGHRCLDRYPPAATLDHMKANTVEAITEGAAKTAPTLQDAFLSSLLEQQTDSTFFLVNGVRLTGKVVSFDRFVVLVHDTVTQMVYKHAISTIVPTVVQASAGAEGQSGRRAPEIVRRPRPRAVVTG